MVRWAVRSTGSALVAFFVKEKVRSRLFFNEASKSLAARIDGDKQREGRRSGRLAGVMVLGTLVMPTS